MHRNGLGTVYRGSLHCPRAGEGSWPVLGCGHLLCLGQPRGPNWCPGCCLPAWPGLVAFHSTALDLLGLVPPVSQPRQLHNGHRAPQKQPLWFPAHGASCGGFHPSTACLASASPGGHFPCTTRAPGCRPTLCSWFSFQPSMASFWVRSQHTHFLPHWQFLQHLTENSCPRTTPCITQGPEAAN